MRRAILYLAAATLATACADNGRTTAPELRRGGTFAQSRVTAVDNLIRELFPKGLETATGKRWDHIDTELGTWDNTSMSWTGNVAEARHHLLELSKFIVLKTPDIDASTLGTETKKHAADRLIFAMNAYAFGGPDAATTLPAAGTDLVIQVVPAGTAALVQTPSQYAGVRLDEGSTAEDRVIAIVEHPASETFARCEGPLPTDRCQYPRFYRFESFPHVKLLTPGRFAVCHSLTGTNARAPGEDDLIRLAHNLPADPNNYTQGAIQEGQIEILPLAGNSGVVDCDAPPPSLGFIGASRRVLYALGRAADRWLLPKTAHAYDQGPEHYGEFFSDFNAVGFAFAYDSFSPATTGLSLVDHAALPLGGSLLLSPAAIWQKGAAWASAQPYLASGFEATFTFRISEVGGDECCNPPGGADGLAFVIRGIGTDVIGGGPGGVGGTVAGYGGHIGYMSISPSVAIEFDTWHNTGSEHGQTYYDSDDMHVGLRVNPSPTASPVETVLAAKTTLESLGIDLEDGSVHTARITLVDGTLTVRLDGQVLSSQSFALPSGLLDVNGRAIIGFTAATGLATEKHEILSWKFRAPIASPVIP